MRMVKVSPVGRATVFLLTPAQSESRHSQNFEKEVDREPPTADAVVVAFAAYINLNSFSQSLELQECCLPVRSER